MGYLSTRRLFPFVSKLLLNLSDVRLTRFPSRHFMQLEGHEEHCSIRMGAKPPPRSIPACHCALFLIWHSECLICSMQHTRGHQFISSPTHITGANSFGHSASPALCCLRQYHCHRTVISWLLSYKPMMPDAVDRSTAYVRLLRWHLSCLRRHLQITGHSYNAKLPTSIAVRFSNGYPAVDKREFQCQFHVLHHITSCCRIQYIDGQSFLFIV